MCDGEGQCLFDVDQRSPAGSRGPSGGIDTRPPQVRAVQTQSLRAGPGEVRATQYRFPQIGANQGGLPEPATGEIDPAQVRPGQHSQAEIRLFDDDWPQPAVLERRAEKTAVPEGAVPQRRPAEPAVAKCRAIVLGVAEIGTTEVAVGEDHPFGSKVGEILVGEVVTGEFTVHPMLHRPYRTASGTSTENVSTISRIQDAPCQMAHTPPSFHSR